MSNENDKPDQERTATVIPWPGTKREAAPEAPAAPVEPASAAASGPEAPADPAAARSPSEAREDGMTLDAFERAIRQAVQEKLSPDEPSFPPRGADELVASVFSALTGKDAKTALAEVRQQLAEQDAGLVAAGDHPGDPIGGDVIDLAAAREARKKVALDQTQRIGGAVKDGFQRFMADLASREHLTGQVTLDGTFLRQHGPSLLSNLFQGLATALMQGAKPAGAASDAGATAPAPFTAPPATPAPTAAVPPQDATPATTPPTGDASDAPPAPPTAPGPVQFKVDLGSILSAIFKPRTPDKPST